ncbi:hypothetical protein BGZ60DRAFT_382429, partial [Tricladium varicosporioides]
LGEVDGVLCADRYKLLEDGRDRKDGSDRLAIALDVLSRANAANEKMPDRLCFPKLVECVD